MLELTVDPGAPIIGDTLQTARIPHGVLITTIERGHETVTPTGETVIQAGDRLTALGSGEDLAQLRCATMPAPATQASPALARS